MDTVVQPTGASRCIFPKEMIMAVELRREQSAEKGSDTELRTETEVLDRLVAKVREDSGRNSEQYLKETIVPHGGE